MILRKVSLEFNQPAVSASSCRVESVNLFRIVASCRCCFYSTFMLERGVIAKDKEKEKKLVFLDILVIF